MERWIDIKGYEGLYQVSDNGRVRSLDRRVGVIDGSVRCFRGKILKPNIATNGYLYVNLYKDGSRKTTYIHSCVLKNFNPCDDVLTVDHINEIKTDNRLCNLRWLSFHDNASRSTRGRFRRSDEHMEGNPRTKKVIGYIDGNVVEEYPCAKYLTIIYGVNYSTLRYYLQKGSIVIDGKEFVYGNNGNKNSKKK